MTTTGKAALVTEALMNHVETMSTGSPTLPVAFPDVEFDPTIEAPDGKYLKVDIFPNDPKWQGLRSGVIDQGLLQISVIYPRNQGSIKPLEIASIILAHFAKGTTLSNGAYRAKIYGEPWISSPIRGDVSVMYPVTIPWAA